MTEREWMECSDPARMLDFVRGKTSDRKLRLYLCGGCRQIIDLLYDAASVASVEVGERLADGQADEKEQWIAHYSAECPTFGHDFDSSFFRQYPEFKTGVVPRLIHMGALPEAALHSDDWQANESACRRLLAAASLAYGCTRHDPRVDGWFYREGDAVDWPGRWLVDCVFGSPFNPVIANRAWLTSVVVSLAEAVYADRAFDRLPILADALEDAGCDHADILGHCRGPGPHVRGCWVVDLILGKS